MQRQETATKAGPAPAALLAAGSGSRLQLTAAQAKRSAAALAVTWVGKTSPTNSTHCVGLCWHPVCCSAEAPCLARLILVLDNCHNLSHLYWPPSWVLRAGCSRPH